MSEASCQGRRMLRTCHPDKGKAQVGRAVHEVWSGHMCEHSGSRLTVSAPCSTTGGDHHALRCRPRARLPALRLLRHPPLPPPPPARSPLPKLATNRDHGTWTFAVDLPAPTGKRTTIRRDGFTTEDTARAALRQLLEEEAAGFNADPHQTVADHLTTWLDTQDLVSALGTLKLDDPAHRHTATPPRSPATSLPTAADG